MKLDKITNKREVDGNEPNPNDEFYTPEYAITPLLKYLKPNSRIWCPFDTQDSLFVKLLKEDGHDVFYTHIVDETDKGDFFNDRYNKESLGKRNIDYIISNPPYSLKTEVLQKLFAMLLGVVGIFESQKRFNMFKDNDFEIMYFNKRISYFRSYDEVKPMLNPPFSSVYICHNILPKQIVFEEVNK